MPVRSAVCASVPIQPIQASFLLISQYIKTSTQPQHSEKRTYRGLSKKSRENDESSRTAARIAWTISAIGSSQCGGQSAANGTLGTGRALCSTLAAPPRCAHEPGEFNDARKRAEKTCIAIVLNDLRKCHRGICIETGDNRSTTREMLVVIFMGCSPQILFASQTTKPIIIRRVETISVQIQCWRRRPATANFSARSAGR
jgi:hypothetical protein